MDSKSLLDMAMQNLPSQICPLTKQPIENPAIFHRDLSDWWPSSLHDMRDDRLANIAIVERSARDAYYAKLKTLPIVLGFSGGLDSATVLHWAMRIFGHVHCLIFDYGQRHKIEIEMAKHYVEKYAMIPPPRGVTEEFLEPIQTASYDVIDMSIINRMADSSLTRDDKKPPRNQSDEEMLSKLPNTFVPGRNVYFITALAQRAYQIGTRHIAMGVNILDYSGYPDCRPEFIESMRDALTVGVFNGEGMGVHAPLMYLNKTNIVRLGRVLGVQYEDTHSCYEGVRGGCGECDSCILRRRAFESIGVMDPAQEKWIKS